MPDRTKKLPSRDEPRPPGWHALDATQAIGELHSTTTGLSSPQASERLAAYGRNALPAAAGRSALARFLAQFDNLLIYVLLGSAVIAAVLGHSVDTAVIVAVVILNAAIGFVQEGRAEQALAAIRTMISPKAAVLREGRRVTVDAGEIVPGDVVLLEAGSRVPADVRLLKARNLRIDEAVLTGESVPAEKTVEAVARNAAVADRHSMAFSGTLVTAGLGSGLVVATGDATEIGRVSSLLARVEQVETPLIRQMNVFARQLTIAVLGLAAVTFAFATLVRGYSVAEAFMVMVGMAVAAIPEGLPAVMTITLAIGVQRMAGRNAIIRRLPAVETLGSVSTICSDKTGTLTRNEMTVSKVVVAHHVYEVGGAGYVPAGGFSEDERHVDVAVAPGLQRIARSALLCNDAAVRDGYGTWRIEGDPMEAALVVLGLKAGFDQDGTAKDFPRLDEIPFDASHRYMATLHRDREGQTFACIKGAPERVLDMCRYQAAGDVLAPIDAAFWERAAQRLAAGGHRVLAIASRPIPDAHTLKHDDVEQGLTLEGVVGLIDPPRPDAVAAVAECHSAGIAVKMITGDHAATAAAIAQQVGLLMPETVATGADVERWDDAVLQRRAAKTNVFARTSPEHKLRLVRALQADGSVVAMTGDGVNDAPALKRADVGVAMGQNGTEAAKEAAEMVLADDNFASIVAAVREGRTVYDNLVKVIAWTLPTNGGETLIIVAAILFGLTLPVTPVQILWINMVTAVGLGLVFAFEPAEPDIMRRRPRSAGTPMLSGFLLWRVILVSLLFAAGAFGIFAWAETHGATHAYARTLVVNAVVVMEIFYLFSVRYLRTTSLTWRGAAGTPAVLAGVGAIIVLQLAFTYLPIMQRLFETQAVGLFDGAVVIAIGAALFVVLEVEKQVRRRIFTSNAPSERRMR